jgi:hypothetical protein
MYQSLGMMVFDDFYQNPHEVRNFALAQDFNVTGNFPGFRTKVLHGGDNTAMKNVFEYIHGKKISWWPEEYNTSFQYTTKDDETWIHYDPTNWAALIYLTPDAPIEAGTALYRHKESKIYRYDRNDPSTDYNGKDTEINDLSKWEQIASVGNIFNRLVMYRGDYYHRSILPGFGDNKHNARLFQTFFYNIEE